MEDSRDVVLDCVIARRFKTLCILSGTEPRSTFNMLQPAAGLISVGLSHLTVNTAAVYLPAKTTSIKSIPHVPLIKFFFSTLPIALNCTGEEINVYTCQII